MRVVNKEYKWLRVTYLISDLPTIPWGSIRFWFTGPTRGVRFLSLWGPNKNRVHLTITDGGVDLVEQDPAVVSLFLGALESKEPRPLIDYLLESDLPPEVLERCQEVADALQHPQVEP